MTKENKQLRELSDEELKQVTGGKEPLNESQRKCENQEYKQNHQDECVKVFSVTMEDSK